MSKEERPGEVIFLEGLNDTPLEDVTRDVDKEISDALEGKEDNGDFFSSVADSENQDRDEVVQGEEGQELNEDYDPIGDSQKSPKSSDTDTPKGEPDIAIDSEVVYRRNALRSLFG